MGDRTKIILSVAPVIAIIIIFYLYPVLWTFNSVFYDFYGNFWGTKVFADIISTSAFQNAFVYTVELALVTTAISIFFAIVTALALRDTFVGKKLMLFLYQTNISIPHIAMATMVLFLLGQSGLISSICYQLGIIDEWYYFPKIVEGTGMVGTVISFSLKFIPFIGLSVLAVLQSLSHDMEDQSMSLGVGKTKTFFHVILPSIKASIFSSSIIVFAYSFGSYEVPTLLGKSQTLATLAYNYYSNVYDINAIYYAYAISLIIAAITISTAMVYLYVSTKSDNKGGVI